MTELLTPTPLFNPVTAAYPPTASEHFAGPLGVLALIPLIPLIRWAACAAPRRALCGAALAWLIATLAPIGTLVLLCGVGAASAWVLLLAWLRRRGWLSARTLIALLWIGLTALLMPLWLHPRWDWYGWEPSRLAALHNIGAAYFYLRFLAWGAALTRQPNDALRPGDTLCWLLYPPCMRLGPVLTRREFLERFDRWNPRAPIDWALAGPRLRNALLGLLGLGLAAAATPIVPKSQVDFFANPAGYSTDQLLRVLYLVPLQIYLYLWSYNELVAGLARCIGIPVDDNFDHLPHATSIRDFWRRWHVTVGRWLREHIYIPLGGNRSSPLITYTAVFGFCAVWHGASWSFLAWGLSQAAALVVQKGWDRLHERTGERYRPRGRAWSVLAWLLTMQYQFMTILMFADFDHSGVRLFGELLQRGAALAV